MMPPILEHEIEHIPGRPNEETKMAVDQLRIDPVYLRKGARPILCAGDGVS